MADLSWINTMIGVGGTLISGGLVQLYHASKERKEKRDKRLHALNEYARVLQDISDRAGLGEHQFNLDESFGATAELLAARKAAYPYLSEMIGLPGYDDLISPAVMLAEDTYLPPSKRSSVYAGTAQILREYIAENPNPPRRKKKR